MDKGQHPTRRKRCSPPGSGLRGLALGLAGALCFQALGAEPSRAPASPAEALISRSEQQIRRDPEVSRREAERALELLAREPNAELEVRARLILCDYFSERDAQRAGSQRSAIVALLPSVTRTGLRSGEQTCGGQIAEASGDNDAAQRLYAQAVRIAEESSDDEMLAGALFQRGYLLGVRGDFAGGLTDLRRAQELYERLQMNMHAVTTLNSIAIIYNRMGDTRQAQSIYERALQSQRAAGLRREEAVTRYNLGRAAESLHQWAQARSYFEGALELSRQLGYDRAQAYALRGLAAVSLAGGESSAALMRIAEAKALLGKVEDARLGAQLALVEGGALRQARRIPEARAALERARNVMEKGDAQAELVSLYDELALTDAAVGDWRSAYQWRSRARDIAERLLRNQIDQRFALLKVEFDTATTQKENAALLKANAANELALTQTRRARALQWLAIALATVLAIVLAALAWHQRRSSLRMRALALSDELTGAPNRRAVLGRLQELLNAPAAGPISVLLLDIDHFKSINDQLGHPTGDKVLRAVAARLRASLRDTDFHGRIGGEEFLIVIPGESVEAAMARAEVLRFQITTIDTSTWFPDGRSLTVSLGVAEFHAGDTLSSILQRADAALYAAKRDGRNRVALAARARQALPSGDR